MTQSTEENNSISDEEILNSYPPTQEQFINAFRDLQLLEKILSLEFDKLPTTSCREMIKIKGNRK